MPALRRPIAEHRRSLIVGQGELPDRPARWVSWMLLLRHRRLQRLRFQTTRIQRGPNDAA